MNKLFGTTIRGIFFAAFAASLIAPAARARIWSKIPSSLARDYSLITDNRGNGNVVTLLWLSPPMLPDRRSMRVARELLNKYIVIGVVHAHRSKNGTMTFDPATMLEAADGSGRPLKSLNRNSMPRSVVRTLSALQTTFNHKLGAMGRGMQWFVFRGPVHACTKGGMSVQFAGQTYTYQTPIPGCRPLK